MASRSAPSASADAFGYATAAFAGAVFCFAIVTAAGISAASQQLSAARRTVRQEQAYYLLAGAATAASLKLLDESGATPFQWTEPSNIGPLKITLEPESRKLSLAELGRPENEAVLNRLVDESERVAIIERAATLPITYDAALYRSSIVNLSNSPKWRECANSLVSPFSRLTAYAMPATGKLTASGEETHAGEFWRVTVDADNGAWLDRVVRLTGLIDSPAAIVGETSGQTAGTRRALCLQSLSEGSSNDPR